MIQQEREKRSLGMVQIVLLVLSLLATSYALGSSIPLVRAATTMYTVQSGDTLSGIATRYGVSVDEIIEANKNLITNPDYIQVGWTLTIPDASSTQQTSGIAQKILGASAILPFFSQDDLIKKLQGAAPAVATTPVSSSSSVGAYEVVKQEFETNGLVVGGAKYTFTNGQWLDSSGKVVTDTTILEQLNKPSAFKNILNKAEAYLGKIIKNAGVAFTIWGGVKTLGPLLTSDQQAVDSAALALSVSYFATKTAKDVGLLQKLGLGGKFLGISGSLWIGAGIAIAIFVLSYKKTDEVTVQYSCYVWDAPTGGRDCERCNEGSLPCTEYQCRSLGQACELVNKGTTEERCVWINPDDVEPPVMQPREASLSNNHYAYTPDNTISPPDRGVFIEYDNGCIPAFTPFSFGITTDEPVLCKVDTVRDRTFAQMKLYFGGSTLSYNHTQTLSLPSVEALEAENLTVQNNGEFSLYVRCQDANGNPSSESPSASFVFNYCVDEGPDTTPPLIVTTNILNNTPVAFNESEIAIDLYVNEPSECRWNHELDTGFDSMEGAFQCSTSIFEMNAQQLYRCSTTLTGIKSRKANEFYFRCRDKPTVTEDRNTNSQGYYFVLQGTQPLVIDEVGPNETIKDSTQTVKVTLSAKTSAGYKEGDATCYYSPSCYDEGGSESDYTPFYYAEGTSSYTHSQDLWLSGGTYTCFIKCVDLGGNADAAQTTYTVETDLTPPQVVRAFHEDASLKISTNEPAACVYSLSSCSYLLEDGISFKTLDDEEHFVSWNADNTYYVKCADEYGNQPAFNSCSFIVRPTQDYRA